MKFEKQFLNDKITASCKTNISPKDYLKRCKQHKLIFWKTIAEANKFSNTTIASTSIFCMFVHLCMWSLPSLLLILLFILPFTVVSSSFWCFTQFSGSSQCLIFHWFIGHSFSLKDSVRYYFKDVLTSLASS